MLKPETGKLEAMQELCTSAFLTAELAKSALDIFILECTLLPPNSSRPPPQKQKACSDKHRPTCKPRQTI